MFIFATRCLFAPRYLKAIVAIAVLVSTANSAVAAPGAATKPNVLFILCDDLGYGDLSCLHFNDSAGAKDFRTPNLDAMASGGAMLRRHYCPAPVCAPSRASLLTGTHQGHAEIRDNQFDKALPDVPTLGTMMRLAGYRTMMIGKYGLQGLTGEDPVQWEAYPTKRGFDEFYGYVRHRDGHVHYPAHRWELGGSQAHKTPKEVWHNDEEISADLGKCYTTDLFAARTKHEIMRRAGGGDDQPWFIMLNFDTPHAALQVPPCPFPTGQGVNGGLQWIGEPGQMINTATGEIDSYRHPDFTGKGYTDVEERFATMVRRIDNVVGDLMATLTDLQIDGNTLVIFSSDNGPHQESYLKGVNYDPTSFQSYGPLDGIKRDVLEGGIRVPTLAHWAGQIPAGTHDDSPSQFHDWMATLAEVARTDAPARCDGVSLLPTLTGSPTRPASTVYVEYQQNGRTPNYEDFRQDRRGRRRGQMQVLFDAGGQIKRMRSDIVSANSDFDVLGVDLQQETELLTGQFDTAALSDQAHAAISQLRRPNASAPRPYDGAIIQSTGPERSFEWQRAAVSGAFDYVPRVNPEIAATSVASIQSDDLLAADFTGVVQWTGGVNLSADGDITIVAPAGSVVRLHRATVIDETTSDEVTVALASGFHPLTITTLINADSEPFTIDLKGTTLQRKEVR